MMYQSKTEVKLENAMQYIWVRLGDADNYNRFDDLTEAADYMTEFGVHQVQRSRKYGVEADGLTGHNDISLFYGDEEAQPTKELSNIDIRLLNSELMKHPLTV
jgi:hypothetical protein